MSQLNNGPIRRVQCVWGFLFRLLVFHRKVAKSEQIWKEALLIFLIKHFWVMMEQNIGKSEFYHELFLYLLFLAKI